MNSEGGQYISPTMDGSAISQAPVTAVAYDASAARCNGIKNYKQWKACRERAERPYTQALNLAQLEQGPRSAAYPAGAPGGQPPQGFASASAPPPAPTVPPGQVTPPSGEKKGEDDWGAFKKNFNIDSRTTIAIGWGMAIGLGIGAIAAIANPAFAGLAIGLGALIGVGLSYVFNENK